MENMDKGLTVPKWGLIVWPKIPQMPKSLFAQFVCPSPKSLDFNERRLHWSSLVRDFNQQEFLIAFHSCKQQNEEKNVIIKINLAFNDLTKSISIS